MSDIFKKLVLSLNNILKKEKSDAVELAAAESTSHILIIDRLNSLHRKFNKALGFILFITVVMAAITFIVLIRTPKIHKISSFEDNASDLKEIMISGFADINTRLDKQKHEQDSINAVNKIIVDHIPNILPIAFVDIKGISSKHGDMRKDSTGRIEIHTGTDFRVNVGTEVVATADGVIRVAKWDDGWGQRVLINHENGYETSYAHLSKIFVKPNEKVKRGQVIGLSGNTGISTGPHLDYRVYYSGKPVDSNLFS